MGLDVIRLAISRGAHVCYALNALYSEQSAHCGKASL